MLTKDMEKLAGPLMGAGSSIGVTRVTPCLAACHGDRRGLKGQVERAQVRACATNGPRLWDGLRSGEH